MADRVTPPGGLLMEAAGCCCCCCWLLVGRPIGRFSTRSRPILRPGTGPEPVCRPHSSRSFIQKFNRWDVVDGTRLPRQPCSSPSPVERISAAYLRSSGELDQGTSGTLVCSSATSTLSSAVVIKQHVRVDLNRFAERLYFITDSVSGDTGRTLIVREPKSVMLHLTSSRIEARIPRVSHLHRTRMCDKRLLQSLRANFP